MAKRRRNGNRAESRGSSSCARLGRTIMTEADTGMVKHPAVALRDEIVRRVTPESVSDGNLVTASGFGSVEFAYRIVNLLKIYNEDEAGELYEMFKHGFAPARYMV